MKINIALQKIVSEFWRVNCGQPDINAWLRQTSLTKSNPIDPESIADKATIIDFVADYRAFRIQRGVLDSYINSILKKERWRFIFSSNQWIHL